MPADRAQLLKSLTAIVGAGHVFTEPHDLSHFGCDRSSTYPIAPLAAVLPGSVAEVQSLIALARTQKLAIVPSGGRTGLSGGAVASKGELVLALDRLNTLSHFNAADRTVRCGAGVVTAELQAFARAKSLLYPVDFAASGSSQVGGNVSTNAGGIKVIRYGMTRNWVAGLKLVTGTGELLDLNRGLQKNNAGYDLRQLVIGAEGTLGVVVEATMQLTHPSADAVVMVLGVPDMGTTMPVLEAFRAAVPLTAFEFFSDAALAKVVAHAGLKAPLATPAPFYVLLEFERLADTTTDAAIAAFEQCVEHGWVRDGCISQNVSQARELWRLREDISETISQWAPYKNDLSTLTSRVPAFLEEVEATVTEACPDFETIWYGHIGDGNVHLNVLKPEGMAAAQFQARSGELSESVARIVQRYEGSISAEHGVGLLKKDYLGCTRSAAEIALMQGIKRLFDPDGIMNPGKIFDS